HRAIERDRPLDQRKGDPLVQRVFDEGAEYRVELPLLDLPVLARGTLPTLAELQVLVAAGRRVALEEESVVADARGHQIVDACAQREDGFLADDAPEPRVALAAESGQSGSKIEGRSVDVEQVAQPSLPINARTTCSPSASARSRIRVASCA